MVAREMEQVGDELTVLLGVNGGNLAKVGNQNYWEG